MRIADVLRRLDAYPRTLEDFSVRTVSGAAGKFLLNYKEIQQINFPIWFQLP